VRLARYGLPGAFEVYGVEYEGPRPDGAYLVDVAELSVPVTYGVATVHWCDALVDEDPPEWDPDAVLAEDEFVLWL
jgi:hypothetical protein